MQCLIVLKLFLAQHFVNMIFCLFFNKEFDIQNFMTISGSSCISIIARTRQETFNNMYIPIYLYIYSVLDEYLWSLSGASSGNRSGIAFRWSTNIVLSSRVPFVQCNFGKRTRLSSKLMSNTLYVLLDQEY